MAGRPDQGDGASVGIVSETKSAQKRGPIVTSTTPTFLYWERGGRAPESFTCKTSGHQQKSRLTLPGASGPWSTCSQSPPGKASRPRALQGL